MSGHSAHGAPVESAPPAVPPQAADAQSPISDAARWHVAETTRILAERRPDLSAAEPLSAVQILAVIVPLRMLVGVAAILPGPARAFAAALVMLPVTFIVAWRFAALFVVLKHQVRRRAAKQVATLPHQVLPTYSVLVPLFREANVLPGLIQALQGLDYPRERLQVLLILEEVDTETRRAVAQIQLPDTFRVLVVPDFAPRTKPKALTYALGFATGDLVVVYDAEDAPAPDQLRRAAQAFVDGGPRIGCVQASLTIDPHQRGWLSRHFAMEYAALFSGLLPVLAAWRLPIPLGGTSNHFPRAVLSASGAWDPYNVTEDADLGLRLARLGWTVAVIDSATQEEAPTTLRAWFTQRTRWIKGYAQTYAVHMRRPATLARETGAAGFLAIQAAIGGALLSALLHPWCYVLLAADAWTGDLLTTSSNPWERALDAIAIFNLAGGILGAMLLCTVAALRSGLGPSIWLIATIPLYWLLVSAAAYRAIWQLAADPHLWEKTPHRDRPRTSE